MGLRTSAALAAFTLTLAAAGEPVAVGGRVLGPRGEPVVGVAVELRSETSRQEAVTGTLTGADGSFRLTAPAPAMWRVRVSAAGRVPMEHGLHPLLAEVQLAPVVPPVEGGRGSQAADGDFRVGGWTRSPAPSGAAGSGSKPAVLDPSAGRPVAGRVVDALTGAPVAGGFAWPTGRPQDVVRTGEAGRFSLLLEPAAELEIAAPGYRTVARRSPAGGGELQVALAPAAAIVGVVVDGKGAPAGGAEVRLELPAPGSASPDRFATYSWPDGRFSFAGLPTGRGGELTATVPGAAGPLEARAGVDRLRPGERRAGLRLAPAHAGVALAGFTVDERGRPIEGAAIEVRTVDGGEVRRAATGADGGFSIPRFAPGESFDLVARHPDYAPARLAGVEVVPGPLLELVLRAGAWLTGRVVDGEGEGVAEAVVTVVERGLAAIGEGALALTEEGGRQLAVEPDGSFELRNLASGVVSLRAGAPGLRDAERTGIEVAAGEPVDGIELVLQPAAMLEGTVRDPDGRPLPRAAVTVTPRTPAGGAPASLFADAAGSYRFDALAAGAVLAVAEHEGFRRAGARIELREGENRLDLELGRGLEVAGHVVDEAGAGVAGAQVAAGGGPGGARSAASGADGGFRLSGLDPGRLELRAAREGFVASATVVVDLAEEPIGGLEIVLQRGGGVHGRLVGVGAGELAGVAVAALAPDGTGVAGAVEAAGYRIAGLAPGEWTVVATAEQGSRQARGTLRIEAGAEAALDLEFGGGLSLEGVARLDGRALAGAEVELVGLAGQGGAVARTDGGGRFSVTGLAEGVWRLRLRDRASGLAHERHLDLFEDLEIALDLDGASLSGRVVDLGMPAPGVAVALRPLVQGAGPGEGAAVLTDGEGRFSFPLVAVGDYLLAARPSGRPAVERPVSVTAGTGGEVVIELAP